VAHREQATGAGAAGDGVPGVLLLARVDHAAVEEGEEAALDGEASADACCVHAGGRGAAGDPVALGGVVEALAEVEGDSVEGACREGTADVVEDAVRAWIPGPLHCGHLALSPSSAAGETLCGRGWRAVGLDDKLATLVLPPIFKLLIFLKFNLCFI
jgi:hypothetical protein